MRSQVLLALTLGECFERQQWHSGFIMPGDVLPPMSGGSTASGRCRPVAREETFYEIEADVPIVAAGEDTGLRVCARQEG